MTASSPRSLGAVQMGLIYVNPEGPNGEPDPLKAARDIRETFRRMAMNDEETVALIAGGHSFGKTHGAGDADLVGPEPEGCPVQGMGLGWISSHGSGKAEDAITSGLEVTWTADADPWGNGFFDNLFGHEWELEKSPAGANQWVAKDAEEIIPDAFDAGRKHKPRMLTTDLALRLDPEYEKISRRFHADLDEFRLAFAKAWYKLLHRDMGPVDRYLGPWVAEPQLWQDPVPAAPASRSPTRTRRASRPRSWTPACPRRTSCVRRGPARRRTATPTSAAAPTAPGSASSRSAAGRSTTASARSSRGSSGSRPSSTPRAGAQVSLADLIVLAGNAGVERRGQGRRSRRHRAVHGRAHRRHAGADRRRVVRGARAAGRRLPQLRPGRREAAAGDAAGRPRLHAQPLRSADDGARRRPAGHRRQRRRQQPRRLRGDRARCTPASSPISSPRASSGRSASEEHVYEGRETGSDNVKWTATAADLVFGSNSQLRAIAEVYASDDARRSSSRDFVAAWVKVMENDRFDLG